ncbi:MAG: trigger factor [Planctomycetes bacterium]|nr:trigger factor [Planctomycetota bacterium]
MQITVENAGGCKRVIVAEIPADVVTEKLSEGFRDVNKQITMPGFRKGKAPKDVLKKRFGREVFDDVRQTLADDVLRQAVEKHALQVLGQPELAELPELKEGAPSTFKLHVEVRPEIELPEYKGLEIDRPAAAVKDQEVTSALRNEQIRRGKMSPVEGAAAKDHFLKTDVHIVVGDETIFHRHGGLLETGLGFVAGLQLPKGDKELVGLSAGEHHEIKIKLPADFPNEEYRGKDAKIVLDVGQVLSFEGPTQEEVQKEMGHETLDAWKEEAKDELRREKEAEIDQLVEDRLIKKISDATKVELPEKYSKAKAAELLQQQAYRMYQHGAPEDEIKQFLEKAKTEGLERVKEQLKVAFVLDAIARKERLVVTEDEMHRHLGEISQQIGRPLEEVAQEFNQRGMMAGIREELRTRKVMKLLRQKAKYKAA